MNFLSCLLILISLSSLYCQTDIRDTLQRYKTKIESEIHIDKKSFTKIVKYISNSPYFKVDIITKEDIDRLASEYHLKEKDIKDIEFVLEKPSSEMFHSEISKTDRWTEKEIVYKGYSIYYSNPS